MYKTTTLKRGDILSIIGCAANDYAGQVAIVPVTKRGMSNVTTSSDSGDYDGGDRVIGYSTGYEIDGDLLFTVGWGDGFAARRLNNDGTMTKLFHDNSFLWRDSTSTYTNLQSIAISKDSKKGVAMTYNVDGYTTFDYSGLLNGGTTFIKDPRPTHSNPQIFIGSQDTAGGWVDSAGSSYMGALAAAGDWIYASEHDARHYKRVMRRNISTGVEERLWMDATAGNIMYPGSAPIDRNGYRGWTMYDEHNDRILWANYYNANFAIIIDASTNTPKSIWCDMGDVGQGDDGYEQGWFIPDPVNAPNVFWVGASGRHSKVDITPCLTGTSPTVLQITYEGSNYPGQLFSNQFRAGTKYQTTTSGQPTDKMVGHPDFMPTTSDRGRAMISGWLDTTNNRYVALYRFDNVTEDTTSLGRGRSYRSDYGSNIVRMYSANGTPWWVQMGYGYDGNGFRIWSDTYKNELIENWSIIYGIYSLDNSASIDFVYWNQLDYFTPSGCSLGFFVSNNNGESWETYTGTTTSEHTFSSTGTQLLCKITGNGTVSKNAYKMSETKDTIVLGSKYAAEMNPSIKSKITRYKLKGKKI
jgi:hypothetical protein